MSFEQFLLGLKECAAARGDNPHKFKETIARCQPVVHGTVAGHVKWCVFISCTLLLVQQGLISFAQLP